ncbi:MAG: hypothetical protein JO019_03665 [Candidatus Kaiserbacteria bacterium]|nr:hypothetical protein [Candidatus Kaiserbacteria bacterium]
MQKLLAAAAPFGVIALLALMRLVPHMPNFAPITAMALFGGVYLNKRYAFIVPLAAMLISDYLLLYVHPFSAQYFDFSHLYGPLALLHSAIVAVYVSFAISALVGLWLKHHKSPLTVVLASIFCSLQFFLITNAAVWMLGEYDRSLLGLWQSYVAGLPFLQGTLFGDLFYTSVLFGSYELARSAVRDRVSSAVSTVA